MGTEREPPTSPSGHAPQKEGGVTDGEEEGDRLPKKPRRRAEGDATQGEGRSLKDEQRGPLTGRQVKPFPLRHRPNHTRYLGDPLGVDE